MAGTILLDADTWDLVLDADGNIAAATEPYSLAQDAASAIRTFLGEVYLDTTVGVDWLGVILGHNPPLTLVKARLAAVAETVPGVASAVVYISSAGNRAVAGQVQVTPASGASVQAANFTVVNPQGA